VYPDIELRTVDPVEREPLDGFLPGWRAEIAQQPAPGGNLQLTTPVEGADRRVQPLAQAGFGRIFGILKPRAEQPARPLQGGSQPCGAVAEDARPLHQPRARRPRFSLQPRATVG